MSSGNQNLLRLIDLAKETSSDKRRELLREMTDLFMEAPASHSEAESESFGAIIGGVAHEMEMAVRQALAERLAQVPTAPRNLILQLANDEIDVARPVLSKSAVLGEADLIALAKAKSQGHLHAIAGRPQVSERLSDALAARGDDAVLERLAGNQGAILSRSAMETIVARAEKVERLRKPIATRGDLPPDLLNEMFFVVSAELKRFILDRMKDVDPALLDAAIRQTERRIKMQGPAQDPEQAKAESLVEQMTKGQAINEALVVALAKQKRMLELTVAVARLAQIDFKTARRVLQDKNPEALAILARACRFDRSTFSTLALMNADAARSLTETYELIALYDKVPFEAAQRVMRFWQVRKAAEKAAA